MPCSDAVPYPDHDWTSFIPIHSFLRFHTSSWTVNPNPLAAETRDFPINVKLPESDALMKPDCWMSCIGFQTVSGVGL